MHDMFETRRSLSLPVRVGISVLLIQSENKDSTIIMHLGVNFTEI
ncbi:hypothetical protein BVRB_8g197310 [Beta vulgaris subsp. vulgaris]|nr:hypothetical protein BVRB_8g197310 [Beta vulgaris subsp. vulgaris]